MKLISFVIMLLSVKEMKAKRVVDMVLVTE